jgi:hypothetical protein
MSLAKGKIWNRIIIKPTPVIKPETTGYGKYFI